MWKILRNLNWSPRKPERRARQRDEEAIQRWCKEDCPRIKKAYQEGWSIAIIDESGFMLQPVVRRTWAPKGQTPIQYSWDRHDQLSKIAALNELPGEICEVFARFGYGCLAAETNIGVVHVCHASDTDIEGFVNKPVLTRWQLFKMPTAPVIRLEIVILDKTHSPYRFESFYNVTEEDQANVLAQLANQDRLYLVFYGDRLRYRFTKVVPHDRQHWQQIDELAAQAMDYWSGLPPEKRDFDQAKAEFMRQYE